MEQLGRRGEGHHGQARHGRRELRRDFEAGGRRLETRWEVSKVETPRLLEQTATSPAGGQATSTTTFEPAGGGTDITIEIDYELPGGFAGGMADKLFVERAIERDIKHSIENFKAICEVEVQVPA